MTHVRRSIAVAGCLTAAPAGRGGPFFFSETDVPSVLGTEHLHAGRCSRIDAFEIDTETGGMTKLTGSAFGPGCTNRRLQHSAEPPGTAAGDVQRRLRPPDRGGRISWDPLDL